MNTVLFIRSHSNNLPSYQERLTGVCNYARSHNWNVQTIDKPSIPQVRKLIEFWSPIGCIIESGDGKNVYPEKVFMGLPVIYLDRSPQTLNEKAFCVANDSADVAQLAAKELLSLGLQNYAFVGNFVKCHWSDERNKKFCDAIRLNGKECRMFDAKDSCDDTIRFRKQLHKWNC